MDDTNKEIPEQAPDTDSQASHKCLKDNITGNLTPSNINQEMDQQYGW